MTQITTAPPAPATPAAPQAGSRRSLNVGLFHGTPGRMRLLTLASSLLCLAFAVGGLFGLRAVDASVARAGANTEQVARVQSIYVDLLKADAAVTNGFLVGGLESPDQRKTYDDAMERVANNIAEAAKAQPADGTALAALNASVQSYAGNVDRARTYNRQVLPVGAGYLKIAGDGLRSETLPIVKTLTSANETRASDEFSFSASGGLVIGLGLLTMAVLLGVGVWLARRTHRWINVPLALATALVAAGLVMTMTHVVTVSRTLNEVHDGGFDSAVAIANARAAAFDGKANEALSLVARGNGAANESAFVAAMTSAQDHLAKAQRADRSGAVLRSRLDDYRAAHYEIRRMDDGGDWPKAVELATRTGQGSASDSFAAFDQASATALEEKLEGLRTTFDKIGTSLLPWLIGLSGLLAALAAGRSMTKRIEEYR